MLCCDFNLSRLIETLGVDLLRKQTSLHLLGHLEGSRVGNIGIYVYITNQCFTYTNKVFTTV